VRGQSLSLSLGELTAHRFFGLFNFSREAVPLLCRRFSFSSRFPRQARRPTHCLVLGTLVAGVIALCRAEICSAWRAVPLVL
jgi:hypothetical protein